MTALPDHIEAAIKTHAAELAQAMAESSNTAQVLEAAEFHRSKIASRISELSNRREAIVTRRRSGTHDHDDGATLALIVADIEELQSIMEDAVSCVMVAQEAHQAASMRCSGHRAAIARLELDAAIAAQMEYCALLAEKLLANAQAISDAQKQDGTYGRPRWIPKRELYEHIRMLTAQAGGL